MTAPSGTYVYCVIESTRLVAGPVPAGVPGATRPRPLPLHGRLWFVAAAVPLDVYGEQAVNAKLPNLEWVSGIAVGHEAVVEHFARMRGATVVPMKLLTLFSSEDKAREELRRRRRAIESAMRRIAGCAEWGVRVFAGPSSVPSTRRTPAAGSTAMTGTAFLAARKAAREADKDARASAIDAAAEVFDVLSGFARAAKQRPRGNEPRGTNPPLLDAAFLVAAASRASFKAAARRQAALCAAAGAQLMLTGPWPAYNFVGDSGETT